MHWFYLMCAILAEIIGTMSLKQNAINNNFLWLSITTISYVSSFVFLTFSLKKIDVGTTYAIWSGVGTAVIAILGWLIFKENMNASKVIAIFFIILGSIMLRYQSA